MKKVLLFGGSGLVGSGIKQFLSDRYQIIAPAHTEVDVTKKNQVAAIIEKVHSDSIIYAVGLADIEKAEREPDLGYLLNAKIPSFIAKKAASFNIPLLYFSTNAVFDGVEKMRPYKETDRTRSISQYGKSKLEGEQMVMKISDKNCVVRLIMPYSAMLTKRKNFVLTILDAFKHEEKIYGITDQFINPICINNIADAVYELIKNCAGGIYHIGATDYVTNIEFIRKLARIFNLNENLIKEISLEEFFRGKKAPRMKFGCLDTSKFKNKISKNTLLSVEESLKFFHDSLTDSPPVPMDIFRQPS